MKTSELTGAALDWAVAKCEGFKYIHPSPAWINKHGARGDAQVMVSNKRNESYDFDPVSNWAQGGPIIEREKIGTIFIGGEWQAQSFLYEGTGCGPTPLIAAMRCYCSSKLGDE